MLNFDGDIDVDVNANVKCEHSVTYALHSACDMTVIGHWGKQNKLGTWAPGVYAHSYMAVDHEIMQSGFQEMQIKYEQ